jgi:hypothetical protein
LVLADGLRREFVNVVGANVSNLRVLPGYFDSLFIAIVRAFDFARKTTLFQSESSRRSMQRSRVLKVVPVAASRQSFDPDIDPDIGSQLRQRLNIGFKENADEISFGFVSADGDAHQPRIFRQGTRPADLKRFILLGKRDPSVSMRECVRLIADRLLALSDNGSFSFFLWRMAIVCTEFDHGDLGYGFKPGGCFPQLHTP